MRRTENVEVTTLCLIYDEDRILLQNRVKKDWQGYTLPGGHVEAGESIVAATIREMREETGLTVKHPQLCGIKQFPIEGGRYLVFLFRTMEFEGELTSSEEGELKWIQRDELDKFPIVNDLKELLQVMEREDLSEFQYVMENGEWLVRLY